ncbi:MAG: hypothetical protein JO007_21955 [Alphaproteobacteria bacterium]|nr:hypothetical protein [Alphaproteobacteria bacterium]
MNWGSLDFVRNTPKAELHVHLGGCIPTSIAKIMLQEFNTDAIRNIDLDGSLSVLNPVSSLSEYLKLRQGLDYIPRGKTCLTQMFGAALDALARDGVVYAELRHSPFKVAKLNDLSFRIALQWALEALDRAKSAFPHIQARLILGIDRANVNIALVHEVLDAFDWLDRPKEIVGLDVAGDESFGITSELAVVLRKATNELGLGITIHAGEIGPPENIWFAIEECDATRIGLGYRPPVTAQVV